MKQFIISTKDKTYWYDETATCKHPFTKEQFIVSGICEFGKHIKDYDLYASEKNYVHKRKNGNVYLVLWEDERGTQWAKRFVWTDELERKFNENVYMENDVYYVELIADTSKLKPIPSYEFEKYLDYELEDDSTEFGGISYRGETLGNFIAEALYNAKDFSMATINKALIECGIKPIKEVC